MPVMDGIEAVAEIRKWEEEQQASESLALSFGEDETQRNPHERIPKPPQRIPIIALTANAISGMREMFLHNGFNDYLAKPIEISKLNELMEKWIPREKRQKPEGSKKTEKPANPPAPPRTFADIEGLDTAQGMMFIGGSESGYREVLDVYSRDCEERLKILREPFDRGKLQAFVTNVHALKSASASVGAGEVSQKAALLEQAGRNGDLGIIEENLGGFVTDLERLIRSIRNVFASESSGSRC
jgi:CheY-like chemotaxis protein